MLCRKYTDNISPFRRIPISKLPEFCWDEFSDDLKSKAPTIYKFASLIVCHSDHRNEVKGTPIAALLKERNREMCGVQSIISIASQVQKKVSMLICSYNVLTHYL